MLLGIQSPEFILDPFGTNVSYIFDRSVILEDKNIPDIITHKSVLTGFTRHRIKGTHHLFKIRVHLFKETTLQNQKNLFTSYKALLGLTGYLKKHTDGIHIFKRDGSGPAMYTVTDVEDSYFDTPDFKDVMLITFKSNEYIAGLIEAPEITTFQADFTGDVFDTNYFILEGQSSSVSNEELSWLASYADNGINYASQQFRLTNFGKLTTDYDVQGEIWIDSPTGWQSILIGLWNSANYYCGIALNNVYTSQGKAYLLIKNNEGEGSFYSSLPVGGGSGLNTSRRYYRITYTQATNELNFYYKAELGDEWILINSTPVVVSGWGGRQYYAGVFAGSYNANSGYVKADNLIISCSLDV